MLCLEKRKRLLEVGFEDWKNFLSSLKEISDPQMEVHLTGGEPLLQAWSRNLLNTERPWAII